MTAYDARSRANTPRILPVPAFLQRTVLALLFMFAIVSIFGSRASAAGPPTIIVGSAANVGSNTAFVSATVKPEGSSTEVFIEYGPTTGYGTNTPAVSLGEGEVAVATRFELTGLKPATSYHYRAVATDAGTPVRGEDATLTTFAQGAEFAPPDGRNYVQVSPINKDAAAALGHFGQVEAAPDGRRVTFGAIDGFPGIPGLPEYPTYLSTLEGQGWGTQGLLPPGGPREVAIRGYSPDLRYVILETDAVLAPQATPKQDNFYVYDSVAHSYTVIGPREPGEESQEAIAVAASLSSCACFLLETSRRLLPNAIPEVVNLYEWREGSLSLVNILPDGTVTPNGGRAGPRSGAIAGGYTENTFSQDGSRVTFTDRATNQLYLRIDKSSTLWVSQPEPPSTLAPGELPPAIWRGTTPDGQFVFFTSEAPLTSNATASPGRPDLYRFDSATRRLEDLTPATPGGANVVGTLGISADGAYIYFVEGASGGGENLLVWHDGLTRSIATLSPNDEEDWFQGQSGSQAQQPASGARSSRVSPDGTALMFTSINRLVPTYDNRNFAEIYHYDYPTGSLACASCNPTGAQATEYAVVDYSGPAVNSPLTLDILTRNLSSDGSEIFFDSREALVPADTNKAMDVYEWQQEGAGGSVHLISTGRSSESAYFGDASSDGSDVFFFTAESLAGQDGDSISDLYDAHVGPGTGQREALATPGPCDSEGCRTSNFSVPTAPAPASARLEGGGNLRVSPSAKLVKKPARKPKRRPRRRHRHHARKAARQHPRRAFSR